jgi:hypothetical protein
VNKEQKLKILKALPTPEELKGFMPGMKPKILLQLLKGDTSKMADVTLLALLMGTVHQLMKQQIPDWDTYLDTDKMGEEEEEVPTPCGDPECEGCVQLAATLKHAEEHGGTVKVMRLTKAQAKEMGLIDEDGNEIKTAGIGHCKDEDEDSTGKSIH